MVIVIFVHDARSIPSPEGAPTHGARPAGYTDQFERPCGMRLVRSISRNRCLSNRYHEATDFGHYVKRNQEVRDQWNQWRRYNVHWSLKFLELRIWIETHIAALSALYSVSRRPLSDLL